jgi:hypothetical protein
MTELPPSPFITNPDARFVLDERAFVSAIEPSPLFLRDPSPEFMSARELMPIVAIIADYAA